MRRLLVFVVLLPSIVSPTRVVSWVWEDARGLDRERPTWGERRVGGGAGTLARGRLRAQMSGAQVKRKLVKNGSVVAVRLHCIQSGT